MFSPFPKNPDVNLTGAEELLNLAKRRISGIGGMYVQKVCEFQQINKTYGLIMTQLKDRVELIKREVKQATDEQHKLAEVMKSFLLKQYQKDVATLPRSKRFIGAIAALSRQVPDWSLEIRWKKLHVQLSPFLTCSMTQAVCPGCGPDSENAGRNNSDLATCPVGQWWKFLPTE